MNKKVISYSVLGVAIAVGAYLAYRKYVKNTDSSGDGQVGSEANYDAILKNIGGNPAKITGGVRVNVASKNIAFDIYENGRFVVGRSSGGNWIYKGDFTDGGKTMTLTDFNAFFGYGNWNKSYKNNSVWANLEEIARVADKYKDYAPSK